MTLPAPVLKAPRTSLRNGQQDEGYRAVPEETAIAFTYNRTAYAVMMATPADLEDFAIGFSLSEGIITHAADIAGLDVIPGDLGVELRMELTGGVAETFTERRRHMAGPVGCGLCGLESLKETLRPLPTFANSLRISHTHITRALADLSRRQTLNHATRAVHAAAFWSLDRGLVAVREDVGRHNALDKLVGALARSQTTPSQGIIVISSRVSVEMVQKAAMMKAPILVAISAPTALAIRTAEDAGITLVAIARDDGFEVFTGRERVDLGARADVAG